MRPPGATPAVIVPTENRNNRVTPPATSVRHPRWSGPIAYELLAVVTGTFVCTPLGPLLLMSSTPAVTFPLPSTVKDASIATGPLPSNPVSDMPYCPVKSASLPDPQAVAVVIVSVSGCVAVCGLGVLESTNCTVKLFVPTSESVAVPVIAPVLGFKLKPVGSVPDITLQVTGNVPSVFVYCSVWL